MFPNPSPAMPANGWRTSSHSGQDGSCVEVAAGAAVLVRDTKDRDGPVLAVAPGAWRSFTSRLKDAGRI